MLTRPKNAKSPHGELGRNQGAPFTLAIDIGGTNTKASVLDRAGRLAAEQIRAPTPTQVSPQAVIATIRCLAEQLPAFERISVGFPGVVKGGKVITAPNLGTRYWAGFHLIEALAHVFKTPVRMLNDAAVQGLGVVEGPGLQCVLTLGTGVGCALFRNRGLLLHLELGQYPVRKGMSFDRYVGQGALEAVGPKKWNDRVRKVIGNVTDLTTCDVLYIGGGNARRITFNLPVHARVVSNTAGITGGVRLWERALDEFFSGEPLAMPNAKVK